MPPNVTYVPAPDVYGGDTFSFSVNDGQAESNVAEVLISISSVNDPPLASGASVRVVDARPAPIRLVASDVDGEALTFRIVQAPTRGVLSGSGPDRTYLSQVGGVASDSFTFEVVDAAGATSRASVAVDITIELAVTRVTPDRGIKAGRDLLSLEGRGFTADTMVEIGGRPCTNVAVVDTTRLTCRSPEGELGPQDVVVSVASTRHTVTTARGFSYEGFDQDLSIVSGVLGPTGPGRKNPSIAVSGNIVVCAWEDPRNLDDVYFTRSVDGGRTWPLLARPIHDTSTRDQRSPSIAIDGAVVVCVWEDRRSGNSTFEIWGTRSVDGGATWSADFRVDADVGNDAQSEPVVVVSGSNVVVAWTDRRDGDDFIYARHSGDGGATWDAEVRVTDTRARNPALAASGSRVVCAWTDLRTGGNGDIYARTSADGGSTWSVGDALVHDVSAADQFRPAIAMVADTVVCAWDDRRDAGGNGDIYAAVSTSGGVSWPGASVRIDDRGATFGRDPTVSFDGAAFLCAWSDGSGGGARPRLSRSLDGTAWSASVGVSGTTNMYLAIPSLSAAAGRAWCAFGSGPIYAARSEDAGVTWQEPQRVSHDQAHQAECDVDVDRHGGLHATWRDNREDTKGDIYHAVSADAGRTWSVHTKVNQNTAVNDLQQPSVVTSGDTLVIAWADARDGDFDIRLRRSPDLGVTFDPEFELSADPTMANQFRPCLAAIGSTIVCTWVDLRDGPSDSYISRSTDGGVTWTPPLLANDATFDRQDPGDVAMVGSTVVVAYTDRAADFGDIRVRRSTDSAATWTGPSIGVSQGQGAGVRQLWARMDLAGADVVVVWLDETPGFPQLYAACSDDEGQTWTVGAPVSSGTTSKSEALVAFAGTTAISAWSDTRGGAYAATSRDRGRTWGAEFSISAGGYSPRCHATPDGWYYFVWSTSNWSNSSGPPRLVRAYFKP